MHWKYWTPHPIWPGSRGYVLESAGRIVAHCAFLPSIYRLGGRSLPAAHFIDWAADESAFGAGVKILRKILPLFSLTCAVGGSADTRKILPLMGFQPNCQVSTHVLPVRPFRHLLHHQSRNWKLPFRLIRNFLARMHASLSLPPGWTIEPATPAAIPNELWQVRDSAAWARQRDPAQTAWFLNCPVVPFALHLARYHGAPRAALLLSLFPAQARLVDIWGAPDVAADTLYRLAAIAAASHAGVCEVVATASTATRRLALARCGFLPAGDRPLVVSPPLGPGEVVDFQELDNDASFLVPASPALLA